MKTPQLGDVLFKRKEDNIPLGFILKVENYTEFYSFKTNKREILPHGLALSGVLMGREEIEKIFPANKNIAIILSLIDKILFFENENTRLKKENEFILDQANDYWNRHHS